ncbi:MAG TPA: class II fructose-1,6-bisphosphate aldolase [Candidatus Nanoarchaeia archaeon]|nr:class II fructose-1,6-bisphosphate aldolase [Candidatus Nanoarchaeia archaeon]
MLADTKKILEKARKNNYAVGHFNINNLETLQGIVQAANNLKAPVIIATSEGAIGYAGINFLYELSRTASELSQVPVALHLDHGKDLQVIRQAIQLGYSSVMIDASHEPFEKNIRLTKTIVQLAHRQGISAEAELGTIGGAEDSVSAKNIIYTDPEKAQEFVARTGCDFLAVAIGTSHGAYKFKGQAGLNMELLKQIRQRTKVPLVLHGASGVPPEIVRQAEKYGADLMGVKGVPDSQIKLAVKNGINKINIDTDLRIAFDAAVRKVLYEQPKDFDSRHLLGPARELITKVAEKKIKIFGSEGKA